MFGVETESGDRVPGVAQKRLIKTRLAKTSCTSVFRRSILYIITGKRKREARNFNLVRTSPYKYSIYLGEIRFCGGITMMSYL